MSDNKKDSLDFDLNFLDPEIVADNSKQPEQIRKEEPSGGWTSSKSLIVAGVVVTIIAVAAGTISKPPNSNPTDNPARGTSSTPPISTPLKTPSDDSVVVGSFRCSRSVSYQADRIRPSTSLAKLESEQAAMNMRWQALRNFGARIAAMEPNQHSPQSRFDQFNALVDEYNSTLGSLKIDAAELEQRVDSFNSQVNAYNAYLTSNCRKAR
jgi:hypothetical protein